MACLEMYNSEHKGQYCPPMSPRISFSNDFVETQQMIRQERSSSREAPTAPAPTDFEFSVTNYSMMSADELFFKGRILPFKDISVTNHGINGMQRTIRDTLLVEDDDDDVVDDEENDVSPRPPKGSTRWKGLLGLKRSHRDNKKSGFIREEVHVSKSSQELLNDGGGSSDGDVEIEI